MNDPVHPQAAFNVPVVADQGAAWTLPLQICNPDANGLPDTNNPINLTGASYKCIVADRKGKNASTIATVSVNVVNSLLGKITLSLTAAQTKLVPAGDYYYDLAVKIGSADPQYYLEGSFVMLSRASQF